MKPERFVITDKVWAQISPVWSLRPFSVTKPLVKIGCVTNWRTRKASVVIPSKSNRKSQIPHDKEVYKWRHLVENYFAKIKEFRGIATPYDKTDVSYIANWNLTAAIIAAR